MADSVRCFEIRLADVEASAPGCIWWFIVGFVGLDGDYGHWFLDAVSVQSATPHYMPSPLERHTAYRAHANGLPGAVNTMPNAVIATECLNWEIPL